MVKMTCTVSGVQLTSSPQVFMMWCPLAVTHLLLLLADTAKHCGLRDFINSRMRAIEGTACLTQSRS